MAETATTSWLKMLKQFEDLKPNVFTGKSDNISTEYWKKDFKKKMLQMDVTSIQRQRLASFYLEGATGKQWDVVWIIDRKLIATWEEFKKVFDRQFIYALEKAIKKSKLIKLTQGDLFMDEYENKLRSLLAFTDGVVLPKATMA